GWPGSERGGRRSIRNRRGAQRERPQKGGRANEEYRSTMHARSLSRVVAAEIFFARPRRV
ncbi:MAG TPA: hypothetical protein VJ144_04265, partial [Candidatus Polarisedimenticolia bacterium]|nr:hypothetical protein [Candidatus Polarisedimenticolia bacterium]